MEVLGEIQSNPLAQVKPCAILVGLLCYAEMKLNHPHQISNHKTKKFPDSCYGDDFSGGIQTGLVSAISRWVGNG